MPFIRGSTVLCPGQLPVLTTLQIAHNRLRTAEDIEELAHCSKLRYIHKCTCIATRGDFEIHLCNSSTLKFIYYTLIPLFSFLPLCFSHSVVDMSHNRLDDPAVQHVLTAMPELVLHHTVEQSREFLLLQIFKYLSLSLSLSLSLM